MSMLGGKRRQRMRRVWLWSASSVEVWEDPYEKRLRLQREERQRELDEMAETVADERKGGGKGATTETDEDDEEEEAPPKKGKADAKWEGGIEAKPTPSSIPVRNIIRLTSERNGGKAPPVSAMRSEHIILRNAKQVAIPGGKVAPLIPALQLGKIPNIHEASSLDSARRRANAAAKATGGDAADFADPETDRYHLEDIQEGKTPRRLNPVCKELYLRDAEFIVTFNMDKNEFWAMPFWKQREAKRKANLF